MEKDNLSSLSREELEDIIQRQQAKIEELTTVPPNDSRTWRDIFGVDEEISSARADERRTNLFTYVQDGAMTIDYAARQANLSVSEFEDNMRNAGFTVPQRHTTLV